MGIELPKPPVPPPAGCGYVGPRPQNNGRRESDEWSLFGTFLSWFWWF